MTTRPIWALLLFWGSIGLIIYTYMLYPLIIALRSYLAPKPVQRQSIEPAISMIIAVYNEAAVIKQKLNNALSLSYPQDKIEIIVVSNGSDDGTVEIARTVSDPRIKLIDLPEKGKNRAVNTAVQAATGDILVFTDADSMMEKDALQYLIAPFNDVAVGGVGGDYHYLKNEQREGEGERTYWDFDRRLKEMQSIGGSMTSATGQIYALRRELFNQIPSGVTDDFFTSTQAVSAHLRLIFEPKAVTYGPIADSRGEFRRKVRVMTRGLNSVKAQKHLLNPSQYGFYSLQLFSHKILRRTMVFPLITMAITAPFLWSAGWIYQLATVGQAGLYGAGLLGFLLQDNKTIGKSKLLTLPYFFCMVNYAALLAVRNTIRGQSFDVWQAERGQTVAPPISPAADQATSQSSLTNEN